MPDRKVVTAAGEVEGEVKTVAEDESKEWEGEEVIIEFDDKPSALDKLADLVGTGS